MKKLSLRLAYGLALVAAAASVPAAASSAVKTATLQFRPATTENGYTQAQMELRYRFIVCGGEVHLAYSLVPNSVRTSTQYRVDGSVVVPSESTPSLSSVALQGRAFRNGLTLASFSDPYAGQSLGMGCFDGQTQRIGSLKELVPGDPNQQQVASYLNGIGLAFERLPVLTNSGIENRQRAALAERDRATQKAQQELAAARAKAAERAIAEAGRKQRAVAARKAEETQARAAAASAVQASADAQAQAQLESEQLAAQQRAALERQGELARSELLEKQRREIAEGRARAEETRRRQEAFGEAASHVAANLGEMLRNADDAAYKRKYARDAERVARNEEAIRHLCVGPDELYVRSPIGISQSVSRQFQDSDCAFQVRWRYHHHGFDLTQRTRVRLTIVGSGPASTMRLGQFAKGGQWISDEIVMGAGMFGNKTKTWEGLLEPGEYIIRVENRWGNEFGRYDLMVENVG